uniref:Putative secreted peptide n=1 Tax=Anopheles braziliensis TaxID=58242 RepID=A0A2M3ZQS1_9DIPT
MNGLRLYSFLLHRPALCAVCCLLFLLLTYCYFVKVSFYSVLRNFLLPYSGLKKVSFSFLEDTFSNVFLTPCPISACVYLLREMSVNIISFQRQILPLKYYAISTI